MENKEKETRNEDTELFNRWEKNHAKAKIFVGLIIVTAGCLVLAREMGSVIPSWLFTWPMLLIVIGMYVGIKHQFHHIGWLILILIGSALLIREYMPQYDFSHYLWPFALIIVGVYVILKPRHRHRHHGRKWHKYKNWRQENEGQKGGQGDDYIDISAVFGGVKKNIISKNFKGGEVNCVFGGSEINLSQADIEGTAKLEINAVFGGQALVLPSHWLVKSELTAVLGNVEDKRPPGKDTDQSKVLILEGNAVFGGIEINSY